MAYTHDPADKTAEMTANNAPSPNVTAADSYYSSSYAAWKAFDYSGGTYWESDVTFPHWISYDFGSSLYVITSYNILGRMGYGPTDWTFEGSTNGSNWTVLDTQTGIPSWNDETIQTFSFSNATAYQHYRLNVSAGIHATTLGIWEIELLGSSVSIPINCSIPISVSISGTVHASPAITSSIVISPRMSGTIMRGKPGDIYEANILIAPQISGTILEEPPPQLNAPITITPIISGTVSYGWKATIGVSRPMRTFKGKGIVSALGTLNVTRPSRVAGFVGNDNPLGILNIIRPARSFYSSGTTGVIGILNIARPSRLFKGTFRQNETAILDITRPRRSISLTGAVGAVGTLNVSIPMRRLSFSGILSAEGILSITRPMRQVLLWTLPTTYASMVMNLKNKGLTEYSNYLFNSMCRFNGVHLGATATGIYDLDSGDTDNGTLIDWNFRTGFLDMIEASVNPTVKKKLKQAWLSYKSNGDIMLTVIQPDGESYEYDLTGYEVYETGLRVKFGKGFRTRYLAFDVSNIDGSSITLDALKLQFDKVLKER
ncbi:MAG: discoidin domain-containing protein [Methanoregula sp.]|jgi:hypothetical protein